MDNDELLATVEREEANCIVHYTSLLSEQRRKAMQYYYGQPYGNEVEGRSQVVTTEVKDAVEGILPPLMAIFTASDEIVRFEPQNPDDEAVAQQATDYVNYIFSRLNNGFLALYCLFKDALLQKNGYVKVYWENYEDNAKETYESLTDMEFQSLTGDDELELLEHTEKPDPIGAQQQQIQIEQMQQQLQQRGIQQQIPQPPPPQLHDAVFRRSRKHGKVCIDPLPPEEVLISREAPNELTKARFVEHRTLRTLSDIREMGYKISDDIADYAPNADFNLERVERLKFDDALAYRQDADSNDPSTKRVWLCEAYLKVDFDGDGIAELRKITKVGKTLLDNEEFDSLPIIGGTAILMPHKHYGLSIYDLVGDLQLQKSTVLRQLFDNAYVANNGRMEVLENMVNMADLLTARPNGVVRVKAMGSVKRIDNPLLGQPFYNLLDYLDKVKINRVGARDFGDAVDPNALNAKAHTAELVSNSAQERINLMARILAEGPVKEIFWKILELISKHEDKPRMVRLAGRWTQVDPREWRNRFDMTVTVGLGTGSQQTTLNGVNMLAQLYSGAFQVGLGGRVITEQNAYHLIHKAAKAVFPKDADALVTDPSSIPPAQPKPDPEMLKIQLAAHKAELNDQQKKDKLAVESQLEHMRQQLEAGKIQFQALTDKAQQDRDHQAEVMKLIVEHEQENRSRIADALAQVAVAKAQGATDQQQTVLGGIVDSLRAQQDHQHQVVQDLIKAHTQAALAPKEIVRGKDGKATGVRPVK